MLTNKFYGRTAAGIAFGVSGQAIAAALALAAFAAPAQAQDSNPVTGQQNSDRTQDGEILVTGFRAALESAVAEKKSRDQVVESISAEDIGKLPDASIAESIARLPGLTSQRLSGRSNIISIRGFAPDFSTTLLNGREQTSTGDNRAVEYDQYPSEIMSQVLVYKTPMASIVGQGLSGTVDLRTVRPLEYGRETLSFGGRGTYTDLGKLNPESHEFGYRVNATYIGQFANDTIGVALSASYLDEPYQIEEFNSWGYAGTGAGGGAPYVIGGSKSYVTSTQLQRLGLQGTLEWRPSPEFTMTFDGFFSDFKDDQIKRGIELPLFWGGAPLSNAQSQGSTVTSGTFSNVEGVVRNDVFQRHAKLYSFGWNNKWESDTGWNAFVDLSYSRTDRHELTLESNAGTARGAGTGATDTIGFTTSETGTRFTHTLDYGDFGTILLTSPLGWGGNQTSVDGRQIINGQDGYYNDRIIEDELVQFRAEVEKELDGFLKAVKFGGNYTGRSKSLTPDEAFLGLVANTDGTVSIPVPAEYRLGTAQQDYLGLGGVIAYDPIALVENGVYQRVPNPYGDVVVKAYYVTEKQITGYLQADIEQELGGSLLTGNFGVQAVVTDQNSRGASAVYLGTLNVPAGCGTPGGATCAPNIGAAFRTVSTDYVDVLPSLNLSFRTPSDFVIRASAAREIIRPRLDDMRATLSYGYAYVDPDGPAGPIPAVANVTGGGGNPSLRPWRANAFDLTFEKYWGSKGYVAAQFFYKDLKSYIYNQDQVIPTSSLALAPPGGGAVVSPTATINVPINGQGGNLYGVEVAGTVPLGELAGVLDGFGVTGGVSYTETEIQPTPGAPAEDIPGYSKWVANGTAYFEKWGFSARASVRYRSTFVGEVSGFAANRVRRRARDETIVDAQIGYEFQPGSSLEGLSIFLQGQNLTDEPFVTTNPNEPFQVIDYQRYGRRFLLGATFKL